MDAQKILLVGDARICPQVAYVMDWQNYEQVDRLTDVNKYAGYKIVVCDFKRHWRRYLPSRGGGRYFYLDDICRELDQQEQWQSAPITPLTAKPRSLWRRINDHIRAGTVGIAMVRRLKRHLTLRNFKLIDRLPVASLRLSELLIKVLYSRPINVACDRLETEARAFDRGELRGCCDVKVPFGFISGSNGLEIYDDVRARIVKLSSLNRSYCLCDLSICQYVKYTPAVNYDLKELRRREYPVTFVLVTDKTCNLKCPSCRPNYITTNDVQNEHIQKVHQDLLTAGWFAKVDDLMVAGMGEAFYSPHYRQLLTKYLQREQITIYSNGTLFNESNWNLIKSRYQKISVTISVDAVTAETYRKLRGGDFTQLLKNLNFISELRKTGQIVHFELCFVVQRDNYHEMAGFVRFSQALLADRVHFLRLGDWGALRPKQYRQKCMLIKNKYLARELYDVLQDPIFKDPRVDLTALQPYLANSAKRYGK